MIVSGYQCDKYQYIVYWIVKTPGLEIIKLYSCSIQLNSKFILLVNVKIPTIVGILTFISMINTTSERLKARNFFISQHFSFYEHSVELSMKKSFKTSGQSSGLETMSGLHLPAQLRRLTFMSRINFVFS